MVPKFPDLSRGNSGSDVPLGEGNGAGGSVVHHVLGGVPPPARRPSPCVGLSAFQADQRAVSGHNGWMFAEGLRVVGGMTPRVMGVDRPGPACGPPECGGQVFSPWPTQGTIATPDSPWSPEDRGQYTDAEIRELHGPVTGARGAWRGRWGCTGPCAGLPLRRLGQPDLKGFELMAASRNRGLRTRQPLRKAGLVRLLHERETGTR